MKSITLISSLFNFLLYACSQNYEPQTHPWATFKEGSWVDVHAYHKMQTGEQNEPCN